VAARVAADLGGGGRLGRLGFRAWGAIAWSAFGLPPPPPYIGGQAPRARRPIPLQVGEGSRVPTRTHLLLPKLGKI
jgi:hypothetical protein